MARATDIAESTQKEWILDVFVVTGGIVPFRDAYKDSVDDDAKAKAVVAGMMLVISEEIHDNKKSLDATGFLPDIPHMIPILVTSECALRMRVR